MNITEVDAEYCTLVLITYYILKLTNARVV